MTHSYRCAWPSGTRPRRFRPAAEVLEARRLLTTPPEVGGVTPLDAFAGVGFKLNPVATITDFVNGQPDTNPGDYQVQVDWGDGSGADSQVQLVAVGNSLLVKGSHTYQIQNNYPVTVMVTGPGGQSASNGTTSVQVAPLPDAASRPPNPPATFPGALPLGQVTLSAGGVTPLDAFAKVGFRLNPIAEVSGFYNGSTDNTPADYHAQVNWGDGPSWDANTGLVSVSSGVLVKGSHVYATQGFYQVTVYITGPDGQTTSETTTSVQVAPLPDAASRPPNHPATFPGAQPLGQVTLSAGGVTPISAATGVGFTNNPVAEVSGSYNGSTDNTPGHYHAQINWGDGPSWDAGATIVTLGSNVQVQGSHTYALPGFYHVTVYVTGPDGQTTSETTTSVNVTGSPPPSKHPLGDFLGTGMSLLDLFDKTLSIIKAFKPDGSTAVNMPFGNPAHTNVPLGGDYDHDGKTDVGIFDATSSTFYVLKSGGGSIVLPFGNPADRNIPLAGDYDGDGKTDVGIFDATSSTFYVLKSGGGSIVLPFGNPADRNIPLSGDYDGDGKTDLGIFDATTSTFYVAKSGGGAIVLPFGNPADQNIPILGDYDGDGRTDVGIFDATTSTFYVAKSGGGSIVLTLGDPKHVQVPFPTTLRLQDV